MPLILDIALTHIAGRGRQTLVAVIGVAVGVGFSIAMAALMQGGQDDFVDQLVNTMPHVHITDEHRAALRQPAEDTFATAEISGLRPSDDRAPSRRAGRSLRSQPGDPGGDPLCRA